MLALGIDAGGTQTRWALADAAGAIVADGFVGGMSATQLASPEGGAAVRAVLAALAQQVLAVGRSAAVCAGLTGFDGAAMEPALWLAEALAMAPAAVTVRSDIELAYLASFQPGEGYLVYAGTGSIAAWIDAEQTLHRAGGRGVTLDDGGGGFWIAREAMRLIWRREDEAPGAWQQSPLARAVFDHVGGSDWALSRQFIYGQDRGAIGRLALAVARAAAADPAARAILEQAGQELARIALALVGRFGPRPMALAGRAAGLHPLIFQAMRAALPAELPLRQISVPAHHAAARIALHFPH
ncbi:MAG: BadF/BadG/BcrA/BcrD ATPase family protein [Duganella sp.]